MTEHTKAQRLAEILQYKIPSMECLEEAANELRRLDALNAELQKLLAWVIDECHVYPESIDEKAFAQRLMSAITHPNSAFTALAKAKEQTDE